MTLPHLPRLARAGWRYRGQERPPFANVSRCEWKGEARYWSVVVPEGHVIAAAWSYSDPLPEYEALRGCFAFYPSRVECTVDGVVVVPQPGRFYGGWITPELVGPFKGEFGSDGW